MMSQPTSPVDICNLALDRLGQAPISSITSPTSIGEYVCSRHYDQVRRELLRSYVFNFSKKPAELAIDVAAAPPFGFTNAYLKPTDFLRLMALGDTSTNDDLNPREFDLVGQYIHTSHGDTNGLKILYVFDETNVVHWDPLFLKAMYLGLAKDIAYKFTLKPSLVTAVTTQFESADQTARAVAGQEKPPRRIQRSRMRDVRRLGSFYRDNRFV